MTDYDALIAAVLDAPHDDTPRLVLADYLDDYASELPDPDKARHRAAMTRGLLDPAGPQRWRTHFPDVATIARRDRRIAVWIDGYCHERPDIQTHQEDAEPAFYFTHGFLREIRLPLVVFVGGECGRCRVPGSGVNRDNHPAPIECPACSGTGRVPGLARELFAAHPLTKCVLTCREPWALDTTNVAWWQSGVQVENRASLPAPLYRLLCGGKGAFGGMTYPTRDDALTALSDACCAYGRALAGLRPLTAPTS